MGLERRGNNYYYYEKERIGGKVRSVYSASGETALMFHWLREDRKQEKEYEKQRKSSETSQETELENILDSFSEISKVFTDGFFLTNGFHQHKRQWRKKRNGTGK